MCAYIHIRMCAYIHICMCIYICVGEGNGNPLQYSGKFYGQRSLVDYGPWGHKESATTAHMHLCAYMDVCVYVYQRLGQINKHPKNASSKEALSLSHLLAVT